MLIMLAKTLLSLLFCGHYFIYKIRVVSTYLQQVLHHLLLAVNVHTSTNEQTILHLPHPLHQNSILRLQVDETYHHLLLEIDFLDSCVYYCGLIKATVNAVIGPFNLSSFQIYNMVLNS